MEGYRRDLQSLIRAGDIPVGSISHAHLIATREDEVLRRHLTPATLNRQMCGWRRFLRWTRDTGLITGDPAQGIAPMRLPRKQPRIPPDQVVLQLLESLRGDGLVNVRDRAMVAVTLYCALRRIEVIRMTLPDVDLEAQTLLVRGKGAKERTVWFNGDVTGPLSEWLAIRPHAGSDAVWLTEAGEPLSREGWANRFRVLRKRAGVDLPSVALHRLRAARATALARALPLPVVQRLLGHSNIATTMRYVGVTDADLMRAAEVPQFSGTGSEKK